MDPVSPAEMRLTLLYVEDDAETVDIVSRIIARKFPLLDVLTASNGETGLDIFKEFKPDIVLTDISMPIMNGLQMAGSIRALDPTTPIIAVTATTDIPCLLEALRIGINRYVLKPVNFELLFQSITDCLTRVSLQRQIRQQHEFILKLSRAVEQNPSMVVIANAQGVIEYVNSKFTTITGHPAEEIIGQHLHVLLDDAMPPVCWDKIRSAISRGAEWRGECVNLRQNGGHFHERVSFSAVNGTDGELLYFVGVLEDVSELQQARQEMLKSQKLESIGLLAGGIAHDFNNIMTGVLGNIALARLMLQDPQKANTLLENAEMACFRAKDLTQQLLTFARGGEPIKKSVALPSLLREAVEFALHGAVVRSEFAIPDDIWPVEADEGQLVQVVHNLVINAVQAMPDGGTLTVGAVNADGPDGEPMVKVTVTDTGSGIAAEHLQRIFDPYFTTKPKGSGLGLATCYSIVRKHGGSITASSVPGQGSTFTILLPAASRPSEPVLPSSAQMPRRGGGRILVMDDEREVREIARAILESLGYEVECASNGEEAIALFRQRIADGRPFAAVILDLTIPGGTGGKEAIKQLRAISPDLIAIVSSGYSNDPVMANYREHGFDSVLTKPYTPQEMHKALDLLFHEDTA